MAIITISQTVSSKGVTPIQHVEQRLLKLTQALLFDASGVVEVYPVFPDDLNHLVGIPTREKTGLLKREPVRGEKPVNYRCYASFHIANEGVGGAI
jgi:hypothetical protein